MVWEWLPALMRGLNMTIRFFLWTLCLSLPLGILLAIVQRKLLKIGQWLLEIYVYVFRGTPLLLQMLFIYFGLPMIGWVLDRNQAALITLVLNYTAYFIEIFRGGIQSIPKGQFEAIRVLSIHPIEGWRSIILPQVWRVVMPSVGNEVISLVKDTSLIYVLGLDELLKAGRTLSNQNASLFPYVYVGIIYLIFTGIVTLTLKWIERRW